MSANLPLLEQAVLSVTTRSIRPASQDLVESLLEAEKLARKSKVHEVRGSPVVSRRGLSDHSFEQLVGTWQLCFITGTQKTRARAGIVLGAGRYVPRLVKILLTYSKTLLATPEEPVEAGSLENRVELGGLKLALTGPTKFLPQKNILIFDFTRIKVQLLGIRLYEGFIRGGQKSEEAFYQTNIGKQAFFAYFLITEKAIAARGKGGGLALWGSSKLS